MSEAGGATRRWRPDWPCPVQRNLSPLRHGGADPTFVARADGSAAFARHTPEGPCTMEVLPRAADGVVEATAWGPGAQWSLDRLPRLLGADDDVVGFEPRHPVLVRAWAQHRHWRIGASDTVFDSLLPTVIEQKVTGQEAFAAYRRLVQRFGQVAPGPPALGLRIAPDATSVRQIASWEWLRLPVDQARSRPIMLAAKVAGSLERAGESGSPALDRALLSVPGIGRWTSAEVRSRTAGDADAVSFGDYHVARNVGWALLGREVDDDELEMILEPFRPHRRRVQGLVALGGLGRPRRGSRMAPRRHLPDSYR